jgi:hypothetical protein
MCWLRHHPLVPKWLNENLDAYLFKHVKFPLLPCCYIARESLLGARSRYFCLFCHSLWGIISSVVLSLDCCKVTEDDDARSLDIVHCVLSPKPLKVGSHQVMTVAIRKYWVLLWIFSGNHLPVQILLNKASLSIMSRIQIMMYCQRLFAWTNNWNTDLHYQMTCKGNAHPCLKQDFKRRMPCSGMLCYVTLVRTDVSKERIASVIRVTRISKLGVMLACILHSHYHKILESYKIWSLDSMMCGL